ncbi:MAG: iron-containing alcohol dehydrogenase [Nitrososphaerota archaeon]
MWEITLPRTIVIADEASEYLKLIEGRKAFIVTDRVIVSLGFVDKIKSYLEEAGLDVKIFDEVEAEPSVENVLKCVEIVREYQPDWIIALGGGSSIDTAKAVWVLYERPDVKIDEINPLTKLGLRNKAKMIAIPTTSGSGSEASWAIVITDNKEKRKMELASREVVPDIVILDPEFTLSMPPRLVADTGVDALANAMEGYVSRWRNDISDVLAIAAIKIIFTYLPRSFRDSRDREAREKMHYAAMLAGAAFSNSQIGVAHAMGHAIGALFKIPHGRTISAVLIPSIEYNLREAGDRYIELAQAVGIGGENYEEILRKFIQRIRELLIEVGEPLTIRDLGISREEFEKNLDELVDKAMMSTGTIANPRIPSREDYVNLYRYAYEGRKIDF